MTESAYHGGEKRDHCYFCGAYGKVEEHHVIPQRFGGPDETENIVELCTSCHKKIESLYDKSFFEWFGIEDETGKRQFHRSCSYGECNEQAHVEIRLANSDSKLAGTKIGCMDHSLEEIANNRPRYWIASEQVVEYNFNTPGLYRLDPQRRKVLFDDDHSSIIPLNRDDILTAKEQNVTPLDESDNEVGDKALLREFAIEMSPDAESNLG